MFVDRFYFGCETDDPITGWAFVNPGGVKLHAMMGSDPDFFKGTVVEKQAAAVLAEYAPSRSAAVTAPA